MKYNSIKILFSALLVLLILITDGSAKITDKELSKPEEEKMELGLGLTYLRINHYRGSDQFKNYYLPLPYFSYSSKNIEAETSFVRGVLYRNDFMSVKLSLSLGFSIESEENDAREGMPDIGYIFEAGPMVEFKLWNSSDNKHKLRISWPIRQVFATEFTSTDMVGIFSVPFLNYIIMPDKYTAGWKLEFSLAVMYGDKNYHDYFYSVDKAYAIPGRPEYSAEGGYSGVHGTFVGNRRFGNVLVLPFIRYDNLTNVVFKDSPLVKRKHFFLFGIGTFYIF